MAMRSWPGGVKVFSREEPESQRGAGGRLAIWAGRLVAARRVRRKMRLRGMGMKRRWAGESFSRYREMFGGDVCEKGESRRRCDFRVFEDEG
jgi:hypothetical protein